MKKLVFLVAVAVLVGLPGWAAATMVSGPFTTTSPISLTKTDWIGTLLFPKFNSALGTLIQVDLHLSSTLNTQLTVTNTGDTSSSGSAKTELMLTVQDPGLNFTDGPQIDLNSSAFGYNLAAGANIASGTLVKSGTSDSTYTDSVILHEFTGTGSISLAAHTFTQTLLANSGGNTSASQFTTALATGTVTYEYTTGPPPPVPVPPTLLLLGSGLVGLLALGRRKRASKS